MSAEPGHSFEIVTHSATNQIGKTLSLPMFVDKKPSAAGNIAIQEYAASRR